MPKARKKGKYGSGRNFAVLPFNSDQALGALADDGVISSALNGVLTHDFYAISADLTAAVTGLTAGEGDPSRVGFAHGDYSDAEIAAKLNLALLGPGNKIAQEISRRQIRTAANFHGDALNTQTSMNLIGRDGSRLIRTALKFMIQSGQELQIWFQNQHGGTLTTGASLRFSGQIYGRWVY